MSSAYDKRSRIALLVALGLFVLTRALTLTAFPIFNDEAIYLQYSQRIHDDWPKNKFISMNGEFADWKPPLQYWITAPFIEWGNDPLLVGRVIACLASVAGFFGVYLFSKELFSQREGLVAALLYVLCPPVLLHNNQFTAETFLFSIAPLVYWALLKAMQPDKPNWIWLLMAAVLGAVLLLFKQSGSLLLAVSIFLPLARLRETPRPAKQLVRNLALVIAVVVCSHFVASAFLPREFQATRAQFDRKWVMSASELLALPLAVWRSNLRVVADYIGSYYSWTVPLFFCGFVWVAGRRKNFSELALAAMCLTGSAGIIFLLRGFNEYLFNTAIIAALLPLLARAFALIAEFVRRNDRALLRYAFLFAAVFTIFHWGYQDVLMRISPGKYIERSSRWAAANYLQSWSTGFGVKEIVAMLATGKESGIVFTDSQWGNPRTALELYSSRRFPNLRLIPISKEFLDSSSTRKLAEDAKKMALRRFAIFSADRSGERGQWIENAEREMCGTRTEIKEHSGQTPIIVCRF